MKKKDVERYLDNNFKNVFLNKRTKKNGRKLIIEIGSLYLDFFTSSVDSDLSFPSTFAFGIGNLQYSNLFNKLIDITDLNFQKNKYMVAWGSNQIRLFDEGKYPILEYDIYTEADAQKMVDEVSDYITNTVLPEWEANPTNEYLEKKVNEKLNENPNFSGLILAKLVGSPNYSAVKQHYQTVSKGWNDWDKQELEKVISFLHNHGQEEILKISEG